jgi:hypothetical protein
LSGIKPHELLAAASQLRKVGAIPSDASPGSSRPPSAGAAAGAAPYADPRQQLMVAIKTRQFQLRKVEVERAAPKAAGRLLPCCWS